jgi:hypothetical protein
MRADAHAGGKGEKNTVPLPWSKVDTHSPSYPHPSPLHPNWHDAEPGRPHCTALKSSQMKVEHAPSSQVCGCESGNVVQLSCRQLHGVLSTDLDIGQVDEMPVQKASFAHALSCWQAFSGLWNLQEKSQHSDLIAFCGEHSYPAA